MVMLQALARMELKSTAIAMAPMARTTTCMQANMYEPSMEMCLSNSLGAGPLLLRMMNWPAALSGQVDEFRPWRKREVSTIMWTAQS